LIAYGQIDGDREREGGQRCGGDSSLPAPSVQKPGQENHAGEAGAGDSHDGEAGRDGEKEGESGDGEEQKLIPRFVWLDSAAAVHHAQEDEVDERDCQIDEGNADPPEKAGLVAKVIEGRAPCLGGEGGVEAEGEDDDPLDPLFYPQRCDVRAVDGEEDDEFVEGVLGALICGDAGPGKSGGSSFDLSLGFQGRFFTGVFGGSGKSTTKSL